MQFKTVSLKHCCDSKMRCNLNISTFVDLLFGSLLKKNKKNMRTSVAFYSYQKESKSGLILTPEVK